MPWMKDYGRGKIRTYDTDELYVDLDNQCFKPLSHPSVGDYIVIVFYLQSLSFDVLYCFK